MNFDGMSNQIPVYIWYICNDFVSLLKNYLTSELFNLYSELEQQFALVVPTIICFRSTFSRIKLKNSH